MSKKIANRMDLPGLRRQSLEMLKALQEIAGYEHGYSTSLGNCECPAFAQKVLERLGLWEDET